MGFLDCVFHGRISRCVHLATLDRWFLGRTVGPVDAKPGGHPDDELTVQQSDDDQAPSLRGDSSGPGRGRALAVGGWAIGDQAVASLSNVALALLIARVSSAREFGAYSLAFGTYVLATGLSRAVWCDAFMIRYSDRPREDQVRHYRDLLGVGVGVGTLGSIVLLATAAAVGNPVASFFVVVAIFLPGLVMQDCWRQTMFAARDSRGAFLCDLLWLGLEIPLLIVAAVVDPHQPLGYLAGWGVAGLLTSATYAFIRRTLPSFVGAARFTRATRDLLPGLFGEYLALTGGDQLLPYGIAGILGLSACGALRAAQLVLGFANVALMGLVPVALAYAVRAYKRGGLPRLKRLQTRLIIPGSLWVVTFGVAFYLMPQSIGRAVTGRSWALARDLVPILALSYVFVWATTINLIALRASARVTRAALTRVVVTATLLVSSLTLAWAKGLTAAVWGMALAGILGAILSTWSSRATRTTGT